MIKRFIVDKRINESMDDYSKVTRDGYKIVRMYQDRYNDLYIIFKREYTLGKEREAVVDYNIGDGYDLSDGTWLYGHYDFDTVDQAENYLFNKIFDKEERYGLKQIYANDLDEDMDNFDRKNDIEGRRCAYSMYMVDVYNFIRWKWPYKEEDNVCKQDIDDFIEEAWDNIRKVFGLNPNRVKKELYDMYSIKYSRADLDEELFSKRGSHSRLREEDEEEINEIVSIYTEDSIRVTNDAVYLLPDGTLSYNDDFCVGTGRFDWNSNSYTDEEDFDICVDVNIYDDGYEGYEIAKEDVINTLLADSDCCKALRRNMKNYLGTAFNKNWKNNKDTIWKMFSKYFRSKPDENIMTVADTELYYDTIWGTYGDAAEDEADELIEKAEQADLYDQLGDYADYYEPDF